MTATERLHHWNGWYDRLPQDWRFQIVLWPLIAIGACNMLLTIGGGFPFGSLVLLAMLCLAAIRLPYVLGWIVPGDAAASGGSGAWRLQIGADWLVGLNRRYDALPEFRGLVMVITILVVAGAINMLLTIKTGFSFGLIFLVVFLALGALRGPYVGGFLKAPPAVAAVSHDPGYGRLPAPTIAPDGVAVPSIAAAETVPWTGGDAAAVVSSPADGATPVRASGVRPEGE